MGPGFLRAVGGRRLRRSHHSHRVRRARTGPPAPLCGDGGTAGARSARRRPLVADRQVAPGLLAYGSEEQRRRLLPRVAAGTLYSAIGMSEHGAGSDLAAVQTRAVATDGGWRLNGTKVWTSGAHLAHQIVVLARTSPLDPAHRHAGFSQFIVPTDSPGITISPIELMNGEHHFNEVTFDDVFVADSDVLGDIGNGWHQVTAELGFERSGPERILSTATFVFSVVRALAASDVDDRTAADVG